MHNVKKHYIKRGVLKQKSKGYLTIISTFYNLAPPQLSNIKQNSVVKDKR